MLAVTAQEHIQVQTRNHDLIVVCNQYVYDNIIVLVNSWLTGNHVHVHLDICMM